MSNKSVKGLLKGLRYISKVFDEEQEEPEMQIGYPTDVKHVGHIGCDGEDDNNGPTWMNNFKPNREDDASSRTDGHNGNEATETKGKVDTSKMSLAVPPKDGIFSPVSSPNQRATDATKKSTKQNASITGRHRSSRRSQSSNQGADPGLQDSNPPGAIKKVRRKKKVSSEGGSTRSAKHKEKNLSIDGADPQVKQDVQF